MHTGLLAHSVASASGEGRTRAPVSAHADPDTRIALAVPLTFTSRPHEKS